MKRLRTEEFFKAATEDVVASVDVERVEAVDQDDLQLMDESAEDWVQAWYKEVNKKHK